MTRSLPITVVALALLVVPTLAHAAEVEVTPAEDLPAAVAALQPGDTLILHEGTYELGARFGVNLVGTAELPIVIRAADGEAAHVHRAGTDQNIVDFDAAEYLTIEGIEFSGGSAGLRFGDARHVTLRGCDVHDTADVAVRANDTGIVYEGFQILRNEIHHTSGTGEGMYLGCNDNGCQFTGALIEGNWVHDTNGEGVSQGDGIELKEGSSNNVVRDNVVHDTGYPCLLVYANAGNPGVNILERNLLWNCGDHGIQAAANAIIRNNIILSSNSDGIAMQPHQSGAPTDLVVSHNTVLHASNDAISLRDAIGDVVIANNAIYAQASEALFVTGGDTSMVTVLGNVGVGGIVGVDGILGAGDIAVDFVAASYAGAPPIDVFPAPGGALVAAADATVLVDDDFNCTPRPAGMPDAGAYLADAAGNPGWTLQAGFKDACDDAGGSTDDGGVDESGSGEEGADSSDGNPSDASASDASADEGATATGDTMTGGSSGAAGADGGDGGRDEGCGCTSGAPIGQTGLLALAVLAFRRRARAYAR